MIARAALALMVLSGLVSCCSSSQVVSDADSEAVSDVRWPDPSSPLDCPSGTNLEEVGHSKYCEDENGEWHGPFVTVEDGLPVEAGFYNHGHLADGWISFHPNGSVKERTVFEDGKRVGTREWFYPDGSMRRVGHYAPPGLHTGVWKQFGPDGDLIGKFEISSGTGTVLEWYDNGQLMTRTEFQKGLKHGVSESFYDDGVKRSRYEYKYGEPDGAGLRWYPNSEPEDSLQYDKGVLNGPSKAWYESGTLRLQGEYRDGKRHGQWLVYHPNGNMRESAYFEAGVRSGPYKEWYESGAKFKIGTWLDGEKHSDWLVYYENGNVSSETTWNRGKREGEQREYHENGTLAAQKHYESGELTGLARWWREDGSLKSEADFVDGRVEEFRWYDEQGILEESCSPEKVGLTRCLEIGESVEE